MYRHALRSSEAAVDFISFLLSKFNPNAASPAVTGRIPIPIGTIGADRVKGSRFDAKKLDAEKLRNRQVTKGWKLKSLDRSVDSILGAAQRLEQEMEAEAKYWEDVLSISEKGWAICYATKTSQFERVDNKKSDGTLAVRFGFSECKFGSFILNISLTKTTAAPEFRDRGRAILHRAEDGSIALDSEIVPSMPKRLQVRIETDGTQSGYSTFSLFHDLDDSIQSQVLKARNSLFEEELWHELLRESRSLVAYGVKVHESTISLPLSTSKKILLKFTAESNDLSSPTNEDNNIANAICTAIHILLSYSHRQRLRQRSQPPPPLSFENTTGNMPIVQCILLRPVIARLYHQAAMASLQRLVSPITAILTKAGFSACYISRASQKPNPGNTQKRFLYLPQSASEKVIDSLVENIQDEVVITIQDPESQRSLTWTIEFRTIMVPVATTQFRVLGCSEAFRAPQSFPGMRELREYLLYATSCAVAEFFTKSTDGEQEPNQWQTTFRANVIRQGIPNTNEFKEICFNFESLPSAGSTVATTLSSTNNEDEKLSLRVDLKYKYNAENLMDENRRTGGTNVWSMDGGETKSLREVVADGSRVETLTVPIRLPLDTE